MFINQLLLRNFRLFEEASVAFNDRMSVVVGVNGAGKSTLLDAMSTLLSCYVGGFDGLSVRRISQSDIRHVTFKHGAFYENVTQLPVELTASGCVAGEEVVWTSLKTKDSPYSASPSAYEAISRLVATHQERLRAGDDTLVLPLIAYYGTGRLWKSETSQKKKDAQLQATFSRLTAYEDCLDAHLTNTTLVSWFERMTFKALQYNTMPPEYAAVRQAVASGLKTLTGLLDIDFQVNLDTHELDLLYEENDNSVRISSSQLSDGYRVVLSLFADIAYRAAMLNPQLGEDALSKTEGIVLVDEIDLHLHPKWQQLILGSLVDTFPKIQFIVTTHAPAVISSVKGSQLVIVDGQAIFTETNGYYGKDVNSVLRELMRVSERPKEVRDCFGKFYDYVDEGDYDAAEAILVELEKLLGGNDAELVACAVQLDLERMELS